MKYDGHNRWWSMCILAMYYCVIEMNIQLYNKYGILKINRHNQANREDINMITIRIYIIPI